VKIIDVWVILHAGFRWSELPWAFRVCSIMGMIGGIYQARLLPPLLFIDSGVFAGPPWGEGLLQIIIFYSLATALSTILPAISVGGAIGLLTLPMSEDHRGILAFFVMISSIYPIIFFSFDVLNFILPLWPLLLVALVWFVLLWMGVRVLRGKPYAES
jgi:hypothetical protein